MKNFNKISFVQTTKLALRYRTTSLNILTDTIKKKLLSQRTSPFPRVITLYITNNCNLNCSMCLNANFRNRNTTNKGMNIETIQKILPELKKYKPFVCITGGEPLLNPDLFKIISLLVRNKILTSMTTNGFLLEKYARQIANSGLEFLSISLDHYEEDIHDRGRGVKTTYRRLIKGLDQLIKARAKTPTNIKINTVITKDNYCNLSKMYDFIEGLEINEWSLQHHSFINPTAQKNIDKYKKIDHLGGYIVGKLIQRDSFFDKKQINVLQEQLREIIRKNSIYKTKLSIKPEMDNIFSYYLGKFPSKKSECIWPFESVNIMNGSKVTLCLGNEIGNLDKIPSIKQIWDAKKTYDFQKLIIKEKVLPLCFRCCGLRFKF